MAGFTDVAKSAGLKPEQAKAIVEAISSITASGERVVLQGFGTFSVKERAARSGRNPKNGEAIEIPAKSVLAFKPSK